MRTSSSERIILDIYLALKALEILYHTNGAAFEERADRNGHIWKVVGEGKKSVGEVHGPKIRGASVKSPKICSCTVIC